MGTGRKKGGLGKGIDSMIPIMEIEESKEEKPKNGDPFLIV